MASAKWQKIDCTPFSFKDNGAELYTIFTKRKISWSNFWWLQKTYDPSVTEPLFLTIFEISIQNLNKREGIKIKIDCHRIFAYKTRGRFFVGNPIPRKKSQSRKISGIFKILRSSLKKSLSRGFGIFWDVAFGLFWEKNNPISPELGIQEFGSDKNLIPRSPLVQNHQFTRNSYVWKIRSRSFKEVGIHVTLYDLFVFLYSII